MIGRGRYLTSVATLTMAGLAGPALASPPAAAAGADYHAYAEVVEVSPRYGWHQVAEPVRECVRTVEPYRQVRRYDHRDYVHEQHRSSAGACGHHEHRGSHGRYHGVRHGRLLHCTETMRNRRVRGIDGYDVTYRYRGATFHRWMAEHPGDAVRVQVSVEPLEPAR